ncbi:GntR family transcriptional regulator [Escherichia coli]|nr:GntR family transcriptional regulator [Escherichia coli]
MSERFNTSRTTIREAIIMLAKGTSA